MKIEPGRYIRPHVVLEAESDADLAKLHELSAHLIGFGAVCRLWDTGDGRHCLTLQLATPDDAPKVP